MPLSSFCVGCLLLGMRPACKCGLYIQWASIRETSFFLYKQLEIVSWRRRLCLLPLSVLGPHLAWTCVCCLCGFICVSILLCVEDAVSLESFISSGSYSLSISLSLCSSLSPEGRDLMETSHVVYFKVPLCILSACKSLCVFLSIAGGSFSDDDWESHWPMSIAECC